MRMHYKCNTARHHLAATVITQTAKSRDNTGDKTKLQATHQTSDETKTWKWTYSTWRMPFSNWVISVLSAVCGMLRIQWLGGNGRSFGDGAASQNLAPAYIALFITSTADDKLWYGQTSSDSSLTSCLPEIRLPLHTHLVLSKHLADDTVARSGNDIRHTIPGDCTTYFCNISWWKLWQPCVVP